MITKKYINKNTEVYRVGFSPDVTYKFRHKNFHFEAFTRDYLLSVWDSKTSNYKDGEINTLWTPFDGHKKEFVTFVQDFLNTHSKIPQDA